MSYQIGFDGAVSAELTQLLCAVEGQLNGRGMHILGQSDARAQAQEPSSASTDRSREPPTKDSCGHCLIIIVVVVIIAVVVGFLVGRHMYKVKSPTN
jgi:hypothetical protein